MASLTECLKRYSVSDEERTQIESYLKRRSSEVESIDKAVGLAIDDMIQYSERSRDNIGAMIELKGGTMPVYNPPDIPEKKAPRRKLKRLQPAAMPTDGIATPLENGRVEDVDKYYQSNEYFEEDDTDVRDTADEHNVKGKENLQGRSKRIEAEKQALDIIEEEKGREASSLFYENPETQMERSFGESAKEELEKVLKEEEELNKIKATEKTIAEKRGWPGKVYKDKEAGTTVKYYQKETKKGTALIQRVGKKWLLSEKEGDKYTSYGKYDTLNDAFDAFDEKLSPAEVEINKEKKKQEEIQEEGRKALSTLSDIETLKKKVVDVRKMVSKVVSTSDLPSDVDNMILESLIDAATTFDPKRGTAFDTYVVGKASAKVRKWWRENKESQDSDTTSEEGANRLSTLDQTTRSDLSDPVVVVDKKEVFSFRPTNTFDKNGNPRTDAQPRTMTKVDGIWIGDNGKKYGKLKKNAEPKFKEDVMAEVNASVKTVEVSEEEKKAILDRINAQRKREADRKKYDYENKEEATEATAETKEEPKKKVVRKKKKASAPAEETVEVVKDTTPEFDPFDASQPSTFSAENEKSTQGLDEKTSKDLNAAINRKNINKDGTLPAPSGDVVEATNENTAKYIQRINEGHYGLQFYQEMLSKAEALPDDADIETVRRDAGLPDSRLKTKADAIDQWTNKIAEVEEYIGDILLANKVYNLRNKPEVKSSTIIRRRNPTPEEVVGDESLPAKDKVPYEGFDSGLELLKYVGRDDQKSDKTARILAQFLLNRPRIRQKLKGVRVYKSSSIRSWYKDGEIYLGSGDMSTSIHEAVHAITSAEIENNTGGARDAIRDLMDRVEKHFLSISTEDAPSIIDAVRETKTGPEFIALLDSMPGWETSGFPDVLYALKNEKEFIAQAFSRPEFQEYLKSIKLEKSIRVEGGVLKDLWDQFVFTVRALLGLDPKQHTMLDEALFLGAKIAGGAESAIGPFNYRFNEVIDTLYPEGGMKLRSIAPFFKKHGVKNFELEMADVMALLHSSFGPEDKISKNSLIIHTIDGFNKFGEVILDQKKIPLGTRDKDKFDAAVEEFDNFFKTSNFMEYFDRYYIPSLRLVSDIDNYDGETYVQIQAGHAQPVRSIEDDTPEHKERLQKILDEVKAGETPKDFILDALKTYGRMRSIKVINVAEEIGDVNLLSDTERFLNLGREFIEYMLQHEDSFHDRSGVERLAGIVLGARGAVSNSLRKDLFSAIGDGYKLENTTEFQEYQVQFEDKVNNPVKGSYKEMFITLPQSEVGWTDGHSAYDKIKNPIVRIRFNTRMLEEEESNTRRKTLFIEEIQGPSKLGSSGRYPAFFDNNKYTIAAKRILTYAKENGFEAITWTPGGYQNAQWGGKQPGLVQLYDETLPSVFKSVIGKKMAEIREINEDGEGNFNSHVIMLSENPIKDSYPAYSQPTETIDQARERRRIVMAALDKKSKPRKELELWGRRFKTAIKGATRSVGDIVRTTVPKLGRVLQQMEWKINEKNVEYQRKIKTFADKYYAMSRPDQRELDLVLKNQHDERYSNIRDTLLSKYGMKRAYAEVEGVLNEIYERSGPVGLHKYKQLKEYFPRRVKDMQAFMIAIKGDPEYNVFQLALDKLREGGRTPTIKEEEDAIHKIFNSGQIPAIALTEPGSSKKRAFPIIPSKFSHFYENSVDSLVNHIYEMNEQISIREFFGDPNRKKLVDRLHVLYKNLERNASRKRKKAAGEQYRGAIFGTKVQQRILGEIELLESKLNDPNAEFTDSLKSIMAKEAPNLTLEQADDVIRAIRARLTQKGMTGAWSSIRNLSLASVLGNPTSAITQIGDLAFSIYAYGPTNTVKAMLGNALIKPEDMDLTHSMKEFQQVGTARMLDKVLKWSGLKGADQFFKTTTMNAALLTAKGLTYEKFVKKHGDILAGDTLQTYKDLHANRNTSLTRFFAFSELAKWQPISLSEMPAMYLTSGNGRIFYALKSYNIKAMNNIYREATENWKKGKLEGAVQVGKLVLFMVMMGATADELKDFLLGKDAGTFRDSVHENVLKTFLLNRYTLERGLRSDPIKSVMGDILVPPTRFLTDPFNDLYSIFTDKPDFKSLQMLPWGKIPYQYMIPAAEKRDMTNLKSEITGEFADGKSFGAIRKRMNKYNAWARKNQENPITFSTLSQAKSRKRKEERR